MNHVSEAVGRGTLLMEGEGVSVVCRTSTELWTGVSSEVGRKVAGLRELLAGVVIVGFV